MTTRLSLRHLLAGAAIIVAVAIALPLLRGCSLFLVKCGDARNIRCALPNEALLRGCFVSEVGETLLLLSVMSQSGNSGDRCQRDPYLSYAGVLTGVFDGEAETWLVSDGYLTHCEPEPGAPDHVYGMADYGRILPDGTEASGEIEVSFADVTQDDDEMNDVLLVHDADRDLAIFLQRRPTSDCN